MSYEGGFMKGFFFLGKEYIYINGDWLVDRNDLLYFIGNVFFIF